MKKKGFTLVELLAVIVILAIIALIATPLIMDVIEKSRKSAAKSSALIYINAVEKQITMDQVKATSIIPNNEVVDVPIIDFKVNGEAPSKGWLEIIDREVINYSIVIGNYVITNGKIKEGTDPVEYIEPEYGEVIQSTYTNIYTNLSPSTPITLTDSSDTSYNGNYAYTRSLYGNVYENGFEVITKNPKENENNNVLEGTNNYNLLNKDNLDSWLYFNIRAVNSTSGIQLSEFKLTFDDGNSFTIAESVEKGYIEPLVLISSQEGEGYIFNNFYNMVSGGITTGSYCQGVFFIKMTNKANLVGYQVKSNKTWNTYDAITAIKLDKSTKISISQLSEL